MARLILLLPGRGRARAGAVVAAAGGGAAGPYAPAVAVAQDGRSLVAWRTLDERTQAGSLRAPRRVLGRRVLDTAGPVAAARRFAYAWTRSDQRRLYARAGRTRTHLDTDRRLVSPQIAANARGDTAVA